MVVFTSRFTAFAVLVSVAAFTLAPPADAAAIAIRGHPSYSSQSHTASAHAASVTPNSASTHPVIPLPARLQKAKQTEHEGSKDKKKKGKKDKKRPKRLASWNTGPARTEVNEIPPLLNRSLPPQPEVVIDGQNDHVEFGRSPEPHHHHHHHHHGGLEKVIVEGDNDNVHVGRSLAPDHSLAERTAEAHVDGSHDNILYSRFPEPHHHHHHHHHHHGDYVDKVIVKGDNDNVHLRRSPSPHHHHHHGNYIDKVIVKGDNVDVKRSYVGRHESESDNDLHFKRSPEPHHHHHHHHHHGGHADTVIVKGDNDNVHVGRSPEPHHHHHHHHHGGYVDKVVVKGDNDNVNLKRLPTPHHHHGNHIDEVVIKGDNDNVHAKRFPHHHHHHHHGDHIEKVVVKGDNDNVHLKRSIAFQDVDGNKYVVPYHEHVFSVIGDNVDENAHGLMKRLEDAVMEGTPGTVDIVSPVIHDAAHNVTSTGTHLASLVLQAPIGPSGALVDASPTSPWVLNASEKNNTQVHLVPITSTTASVNGTATNASTVAEANEDIPVLLTVSIFDPNSASMVAYCATFDPSPPAPAPLTAEPCFAGESSTPHKSQTFSYTPATGGLSPTWFNGEDDGKDPESDDEASAPQDPHTPQGAGAASVTSVEEDDSLGDFGNATAPASVASAGGNTTTNDASQDGLKSRTQNVKMIFTPATPELPASVNRLQDGSGPLLPNVTGASVPSPTIASNLTQGSALSGAGSPPTSTASSGSTESTDGAKDLSVMVGIARDESSIVSSAGVVMMTPVSTAPYKWRFRRDHL